MTEKMWYIHDPQKALQFEAFLKEFKEKDPELYDEAYGLLFSKYTDFTVDDPVDCPLAYWTVDLDAVRILKNIIDRKISLDVYDDITLAKVIETLKGVDNAAFIVTLDKSFTKLLKDEQTAKYIARMANLAVLINQLLELIQKIRQLN